MPGKSNFYIPDNIFLNNAHYSFPLESGVMVSAFLEKILIGMCEFNANGQLRFSASSIVIPSKNFVEFTQVVKKAYKALKDESEEKFEDLIYKHSSTHFLMGKYQPWQDEWGFSMFYKWRHGSDRNFQTHVAMKTRDPVDISKLEDPEYQPLKKGVFNLQLDDLEMLVSHLDTLLQYTHYQSDEHKRKVMDFVNYATSEEKHKKYLVEKLKNYEGMRVAEKIKIINNILTAMFEDQGKSENTYDIQCYLDILTNKTALIFALLNNRLME